MECCSRTNHGFHVACRDMRTTVSFNRECEDPIVLCFVHTHDSTCVDRQNVQSCRKQKTCGRISKSPCSLTHGLFFSPCPCFCLYLWAVPCPCHSFLCLCSCPSFGLTFALDDSVNFHVVPGFLRIANNPRPPVSLSCSRCQFLLSVSVAVCTV